MLLTVAVTALPPMETKSRFLQAPEEALLSPHPSEASFTYLSLSFLSSSFTGSIFSFTSHLPLTSTSLLDGGER